MALKVTKTDVWAATIKDQPGGLADCLAALAAAGANLECMIARRRPEKPGRGVVFVTPLKGRRVKTAAAKAGFRPTHRVATLRIEGYDRRGMSTELTRAVGAAGVNMRGVSGAVVGGKFVCYFGFDSDRAATKAAAAIRRALK
jgi:hypothetical protein